MNVKTVRRILCLLTVLILAAVLAVGAFAHEARFDPEDPQPPEGTESTEPSLEIAYKNLSYQDSTYLLFAVDYENVPNPNQIQLICWTAWDGNAFLKDSLADDPGTFVCTYRGQQTINEVPHAVFQSKGLSPRMIADVFYCRAYVTIDGTDYYSDVLKYSGLQYIKDLSERDDVTEADRNIVTTLRAYANAAQIRFNYNTDNLAGDPHGFISVDGAALPDGFTYGLYKNGTALTITAEVPAGDSLARWVDGAGNNLGSENPLQLTVNGDRHIRAILASSPDSCDHVYGDLIPAADATCTEAGCVAHYHCSACGRDFDADHEYIENAVIPALGHDWVDVEAVAASCIPGHTAYRYCDRCGEQEGYAELPANADHTYVEETVAPSGEIRGYINHVCSVCGDSYKTDYNYSLYSGVDFSTEGKYPIPQYFDSQTYTIEAAVQLADTVNSRAGVILGSYDNANPAFNLEVYNNGKLRLFFMNSTSEKYSYLFNTDIRVHVEEQADPEEGEGEGEGSTAAQVPPAVKYLTVTIEPGEAKLYVDGVYAETITLDNFVFPTIGRNLMLGGDNRAGNSQAFQGRIYSVSIFSDLRTESEIVSDLAIADANDQHCLFSINLLNSNAVSQGVTLDPVQESAQVYTAEELAYHASHGTKNIEVMNDIVLDRTVYVFSEPDAAGDSPVTIFSNADYTILRDPDFYGDMFVLGENSYGRNLLLDDISSELNLGKDSASGTLTIDGNRDNVTDEVYGSLIYVNNAGTVNINGAVLTNNRKLGNARTLGMKQSYANYIGGAAIVNINGCVNLNSGLISNCSVNSTDVSGGVSSAENYRQSSYGGAIYNCSNFTMNGGTIRGETSDGSNVQAAFYGGAIVNRGRMELLGGVIENWAASHAGGAIYMVSTTGATLNIGDENGQASDVIFRNNSTPSSGGFVYAAAACRVLIRGGATFDGNHSGNTGGAIYAGPTTVIGPNTLFTNNSSGNNASGGAIYFSTPDSEMTLKRVTGATFIGNTSGKYGGAIFDNGSEMQISDCTFESNTADSEGGAIHCAIYSDVTIEDSTFTGNESGNAGAITLRGTEAEISGCTFSGNTATGSGGAFYVSYTTVTVTEGETSQSTQIPSTLTVDDTDFVSNTAANNGGAIYTSSGSTLTATDSEFTTNGARSGGAVYGTYTTISGSGNVFDRNTATANYDENDAYVDGGIGGALVSTSGTLTLSGTSFTGNTGYDGGGIYVTGGTATLTDLTATGNTASHVGGFSYTKSNTLTVSGTSVIGSASDDTLGNSCGNNGGALYGDTGAQMILNGVVIGNNTAGNAGGALYVRNHFEATNAQFVNNSANYGGALFIYDTTDATLDGCTLSGNQASSSTGGAVYINAGTGHTATLSAEDTAFNGNSSATYGGAVYVNAGNTLETDGCTFANNTAGSYGGAVHVASGAVLTSTDTTFRSNTATSGGGAVSTYKSSSNDSRATVTLDDVTLDSNSSANGGALYISEADVTLNGVATGNTTTGSGGIGYVNVSSVVTINEITATGNSSSSHGGCFYINRSTINVTNDDTGKIIFGALESDDPENPVDLDALKNSSSGGSGGALYGTVDAIFNVKNAVFANNTCYLFGGAICAKPASGTSTVTTQNVQFIGNQATRINSSTNYGGGAIYLNNATLSDTGSTFSGNSGSYGGAILVTGTSTAGLSGSSFTGNSTTRYAGGAIEIEDSAALTAANATFSNNTGYTTGGAINNVSTGAHTISNTTFSGNRASGTVGGAINTSGTGAFTITNSTFSVNAATTLGGAINSTGTGALTVSDTQFTGNSSGSHGGAVRVYSAAADGDGNPAAPSSFTRCTFTNNAATGGSANGGAFYIASASVTTLTDVVFNGNTATAGTDNAMYLAGTCQVTIDGITFYLPCGTPQIGTSTKNVKLTVHSDRVYDQNGNALNITAGYIGGSATVTYVTGE